jgi:hypothetical protein
LSEPENHEFGVGVEKVTELCQNQVVNRHWQIEKFPEVDLGEEDSMPYVLGVCFHLNLDQVSQIVLG